MKKLLMIAVAVPLAAPALASDNEAKIGGRIFTSIEHERNGKGQSATDISDNNSRIWIMSRVSVPPVSRAVSAGLGGQGGEEGDAGVADLQDPRVDEGAPLQRRAQRPVQARLQVELPPVGHHVGEQVAEEGRVVVEEVAQVLRDRKSVV